MMENQLLHKFAIIASAACGGAGCYSGSDSPILEFPSALIDSDTNNGSFEDWSGAEVIEFEDFTRNHVAAFSIPEDARRYRAQIPGWMLLSNNRHSGFGVLRSASHRHAYAFGSRSAHMVLVSDAHGAGAAWQAGAAIEVRYDAICLYEPQDFERWSKGGVTMDKLLRSGVMLIFNGDQDYLANHHGKPDAPGVRRWLPGPTTKDGYAPREILSSGALSHVLSEGDAQALVEHGLIVAINTSGVNSRENIIDNVRASVVREGS